MNTHPPTYYQHIERIAIALETIAASHKDNKLQQFKQAVNLVYAKKELADVNASDDHQSNIVESIEQNLDKQREQYKNSILKKLQKPNNDVAIKPTPLD